MTVVLSLRISPCIHMHCKVKVGATFRRKHQAAEQLLILVDSSLEADAAHYWQVDPDRFLLGQFHGHQEPDWRNNKKIIVRERPYV